MKIKLLILLTFLLIGCKEQEQKEQQFFYLKPESNSRLAHTQYYEVKVLRKFPHNESFYTQGLLYHNGLLYESTGQYGASGLYVIDTASGKVLKSIKIDEKKFAEGIALWRNKIYQLTWQENICYVYHLSTLQLVRTHSYLGEGWGLASDGQRFFFSDGSFVLKIVNPENFSFIGTKSIYYSNGRPVNNLNELEFDGNGYLYANIWQEDKIVKIDTAAARVIGIIDLSPLRKIVSKSGYPEVANGIAFIPERKTFILTGKYWPYYFEVEFVENKN